MKLARLLRRLALAASLACVLPLAAQPNPAWSHPFPPFRIAGNLYYVGSEELGAYLIATPKGLILINSNLASSPPLIRKSVEALGFHFSDIKILLISHAHNDHCAGSAEILKQTRARYYVMDADVPIVESGGRKDFFFGADKTMWFPPAHVDRVLHDGDTVELGGTVLTAHLTAGHTKGTTTWTMDEEENGRLLHAVIVGSPNVLDGYQLVNNSAYPQIAADFRHQFAVLKALPCDLFLGAHGSYFHLQEKYARRLKGDRDVFIDPAGYQSFVDRHERSFEQDLERQSAARTTAR